jgi:hypothetical protein
VGRWVQKYGILEYKIRRDEEGKPVSAQNAQRLQTADAGVEKPGILPGIYQELLPSTIFGKLADMGFSLPPFSEQIVPLEMDEDHARQYHWLHDTLLDHIRAGLSSFDSRRIHEAWALMSVWIQNTLSRPNSAFRKELVRWKPDPERGHEPYLIERIPAWYDWYERDDALVRELLDKHALRPGEWPLLLFAANRDQMLLPKERWLLETAISQQKRGRKVVVYIRQTGTRDIQPRIQELLEGARLRARILPDHVPARQRERWIEAHAPEMDVLITNPRRVETGLGAPRSAYL